MASRNKEATSQEVPKSQVLVTLPPSPAPLLIDPGLHAMKDLKKKRSLQEIEEEELLPQKGTKQQNLAEVRLPQRVWSPWLEVDGAAIPWNTSVREYQRGHSAHVAESLEQPLLLPKDMNAQRKLKQYDLFLSLKRDLALVSPHSHSFIYFSTSMLSWLFMRDYNIVLMQITQEVYVAEEWINRARNNARNEANLCLNAEKTLGAAKEENKDLATMLTTSERDWNSTLASLKNAETQTEDQLKLLYQTEIELATTKQLALDLKGELQKAREAAQLAKEALEAEKKAAYALGMEDIQARLTEELAEACRDYCDATWAEALNIAGVLVDSEWRQQGKVYYHPDIRVIPSDLPLPSTLAPKSLEQPLTTQAAIPLLDVPQGSNLAGDQVQGVEEPKDQGKGKGKKSFSEVKDATKDKDAAAKAKEAEGETKEANNKAKDVPSSRPGQQEDPPIPKAKAQNLGTFYSNQGFCVDILSECNVLILFNRNVFFFFFFSFFFFFLISEIPCTFTLYALRIITIMNSVALLLPYT